MAQSPPALQERALPTLNTDGTRRRIRPQLSTGRIHRARFWVGWSLILLFVGLPFVRVGGAPAVLLDVAAREFTFFVPLEDFVPDFMTVDFDALYQPGEIAQLDREQLKHVLETELPC